MRIHPFKVSIPRICKTVEAWESSCRCGSCETLHLRIIDDIDGEILEYNTKSEGTWESPSMNDPEKLTALASVIFEMALRLKD